MVLSAHNISYRNLSTSDRLIKLYSDYKEVLMTTSFGITSAYLLYHISKIKPEQKIYFLDTGYHFKETLSYKDELIEMLNLNVVTLKAHNTRQQITGEERLWKKDPDLCCYLNKVEPFMHIKEKYDVWISGLMHSQNSFRNNLDVFELRNGIIKFHPIINMSESEVLQKMSDLNLPFHPLYEKGFNSVGCAPCTRPGTNRTGRWRDNSKQECGLHN